MLHSFWIPQLGGNAGDVQDIAIWAVPFGIIGGRIYHVISSPRAYFGEGGDRPGDGVGLAHRGRVRDSEQLPAGISESALRSGLDVRAHPGGPGDRPPVPHLGRRRTGLQRRRGPRCNPAGCFRAARPGSRCRRQQQRSDGVGRAGAGVRRRDRHGSRSGSPAGARPGARARFAPSRRWPTGQPRTRRTFRRLRLPARSS